MFRSLVLTFLFSTAAVFAHEYDDYLLLMKNHPNTLGPWGNWKEGEIEILSTPSDIKEAEAATGRHVGIIAQDKYWIWINDAVRFPNGKYGVYGRILWQQTLKGPT